jgi:hypothetical protein
VIVEFAAAWAWWLLALVPAVWLAASRGVIGSQIRHGAPHVIVRSLMLVALVGALARPVVSWPSSQTAIVYLVDVSDSIATRAWTQAVEAIDRIDRGVHPAYSRILAFAGETVSIPDTAALRRMADARAVPDEIGRMVRPDVTDIEQALLAAQAAIDPTASGRIVIVSDGRQTQGDSQRAVLRLAASRVPVFAEPAPVKSLDDTWIEDLRVPREPVAKAPATLDVVVGTQAATDVDIALQEDGRAIAHRRVSIPAGISTVPVEVEWATAGAHLVGASIEAGRDAVKENDSFTREVVVAPAIRVLVVRSNTKDASPASRALADAGMVVTVAQPGELPEVPEPLRPFDVVVVDNVDRALLSRRAMTALGTWVQESGGGLLFAGGDAVIGESADSTRAGYRHSDLERILPVTFDRDDEPDVALVIVLDRSWSMYGPAMELSKAAAEAAANTLTPSQMLGVLSFNDNAEWNVPLARVRDVAGTLHDAIARIAASGPTAIFPALEYAYDALAAVRARAKHVILLSDGQTAARDFEGLVQKMKGARITVSSVALGPEAEVALLGSIARWGGGRAYVVANASQIPEIFVTEARKAATRPDEDERAIKPVSRHRMNIGAIDDDLPSLTGRNVVTRKPQSIEVLGTSRGDPLLTFWQAGLGRTAMFAADLDGRWTRDWIAWPGFESALSAIVRSLVSRGPDTSTLHIQRGDRQGAGQSFRVTLDERDEDGQPRNLLAPEADVRQGGERARLPLSQTGPGRYEARAVADVTAPLFLTVTEPSGATTTRIVAPDRGAEYRFGPADEARLSAMAADTGGSVRPSADAVRNARPASGTVRHPLAPWCLALALVLWPVDIGLRRLWRYAAHSTAAAGAARR